MEFAQGKMSAERSNQMSWLASCISHTMKRLSNTLKKLQINGVHYLYSCYCFSLLVNCTELEMVKNYWAWICTLFLSTTEDSQFSDSYVSLKSALKYRPESFTDFQRIYKEIGIKTDLVEEIIELSMDDSNIDNASDGKTLSSIIKMCLLINK